ncbi:MAG: gliding motility-associated C-terminal domain-containing protein [Crocinitomicaceae bacterium]|nr:gliding motility-associated C-terminal domain-containing protein [Crocinitomicaceae bacterium]
MLKLGSLVVSFFLLQFAYTQQLIINEVSQGVTANGEYVEFVVIGTPTCVTPVPTVDLRTVIFDDNNGYFASGAGTGIAAGAIRFANIPFWQNVPQGTIILIYDNTNANTNLPADDLSQTDGNCKLVIPINSTLFEKATVSPTSTNSAYPPTASWSTGTTWSPLGMANGGDSFQLPLSTNTTIPFHAVSWGNNTTNPIIYFAGSAAGTVFSFKNTVSNNWNTQSNWSTGSNSADETPGSPNSTENAAWISSLNPQCGTTLPMTITTSVTNETCQGSCNGSASVSVNNGSGPFTYLWSNGQTSSTLSNLCAGNYSVTVTAANGCSDSESFTITSGVSVGITTIQAAGPFLTTNSPLQLIGSPTGGTWTSNCSSCLSATGVFDPADSGVGSFQVCYQTGSGNCISDTCITLLVNAPCSPQTTSSNSVICPEDSIQLFGNWEHLAGVYSGTFIDQNGCDSTHSVTLSLYTVNPINESVSFCEGDSIEVFNTWYVVPAIATQVEQTTNGCNYMHTVTINLENCEIEIPTVFIPNVFTPNADQVNDTFEIVIYGGLVEDAFIINRWGEVVHSFDPSNLKWDGTDDATKQRIQDGVYTYIVNFKPSEAPIQVYTGFITIIR